MKLLNTTIRKLGEAIIIFLLIFCINNYFGNKEQLLNADGKGYYDYLPSLFIYGDLPSPEKNESEQTKVSDRINKTDFYVHYKNCRVNKYPCGVAVLLSPIFTCADFCAPLIGYANDGFSLPYQKAVFYGALIYLFLALLFLRKLLELYCFKTSTIFFIQVIVVFSTPIITYVYAEPGFSHVYSFFAITAFLFYVKSFFLKTQIKHFLLACFFLGLVVILRQVNILIILMIPFVAGSFEDLKSKVVIILKNRLAIIKGLLIFFSIIFIQLYLWHYQTGEYFVYSYQGETFNFLQPHFIDILFSYRKGFFVYTPVFIFLFFGLLYYLKEGNYYLFSSGLLFFVILTYVLSSWYCWYYGMSYGLRAYIDHFSVFCIFLAAAIDKSTKPVKIVFVLLMLFTIPLNFIQTWQYDKYIFHWSEMDKRKYWEVFLETENRFRGYLWKKEYNIEKSSERIINEKNLGEVYVEKNTTYEVVVFNEADTFKLDEVKLVAISFENTFNSNNDGHVEFFIQGEESSKIYFSAGTPFIHFSEEGMDKNQVGLFVYELPTIIERERKKIFIKIVSTDQATTLKDIKIKFLK